MLAARFHIRYPPSLMTTNHFDGPFLAVPVWAVEAIKDRGHQRDLQVLVGLIGCMDIRTRTITASYQQVADFVGISRETVIRSVKWLGQEGVIKIERSSNSVNTYTVVFKPRGGVTGDTPGSHGRHSGVSALTPLDHAGGVTGDTTNSVVSPAQRGDSNTTEIYMDNREVLEIIESAPCGSQEDETMILGEDPHEVKKEAPAPTKARPASKKPFDLAERFMHHPKSLMSRSYTPRDRVILMTAFKKLLDGNIARQTIVKMINEFWDNPRFSAYTDPAQAFASRPVQKSLMESIDIKIEDDNPVLNLMANDFVRTSEALPWSVSADQDLQKAIMMRCMDACYRYPEVIATIAMMWGGEFTDRAFLNALEDFNTLVLWHCSQDPSDVHELHERLSFIKLPTVLYEKEPTMLRSPAGTIGEAIYNYRRFGNA